VSFSGSRRRFLVRGVLVGGGLLLGYGLGKPRDLLGRGEMFAANGDEVALNAWVKIATDGTVTIAVPRVEMGQGVHTALPMILAEEMDIAWAQVKVEQAAINSLFANIVGWTDLVPWDDADDGAIGVTLRWTYARLARVLGIQVTGGSTSVRDAWLPMRTAGAAARTLLLSAAAQHLVVGYESLTVRDGVISHAASGRSVTFGEMAARAAQLPAPRSVVFKQPGDYTLLGRPLPRLDIPAKIDGSARFGIDTYEPGMLFAAIKASPVFGGKLGKIDVEAIKRAPQILEVVALPDAVAVVANTYWHAQQALNGAEITFDGPADPGSIEKIYASFEQALSDGSFFPYEDVGDAPSAFQEEPGITAEYRVPLLAHACMEPLNCTARVTADGAEIWCGNQAPDLLQMNAANFLDCARAKVHVHTPYLGGGFGRRSEPDVMLQTLAIARAMPGRLIKLVWSREEDFQHDTYRPPAIVRLQARLAEDGRINAWLHQGISPDISPKFIGRLYPGLPIKGPDRTSVDGAVFLPYAFAERRVEHCAVSVDPVPIGTWRSVGNSQNAFFVESFMDELALAAKQDPMSFRLAHLTENARATLVLARLRERSGWDTPVAAGRARGVAFCRIYDSFIGQVAEISLAAGAIRVHRVTCVVDCGQVINPDIVEAQLESGILFGLTAALWGEVPYAAGRVTLSNFNDYRILKMAETPLIDLEIQRSQEAPGGVGELGTPPIAPALANALAALTGQRLRTLPLKI
jgi:isoquinoline 1-oxidoreductase subunit beta